MNNPEIFQFRLFNYTHCLHYHKIKSIVHFNKYNDIFIRQLRNFISKVKISDKGNEFSNNNKRFSNS